MIKACIFDMDGVIVDTEGMHMEAFRRFLAGYDIRCTVEFTRSLIGYSIEDNVVQIKKAYPGIITLPLEEAVKKRNDIYMDLLSAAELPPEPGVIDLLSSCKKLHIQLALASSSEKRQVEVVLKGTLQSYSTWFDVIVSGDDVAEKKPSPEIYLLAVKKLGIPAHDCLAFEDSRAGIESAKAAGITCYAVRSRHVAEAELLAADRIIDSLSEVTLNERRDN